VGVPPLSRRIAYPAGVVSGLLYWLAFPGKQNLGAWHGLLALVAFIPMWVAVLGQPPKRALVVGLLAGATMNIAGFTWLVDMLETFSGFPAFLCFFFACLVCVYQGGRIGLMGWLFGRATARGWPAATMFVIAFAASELAYPLLFPWYFAATTYQLPALSQTAELGGPILVGSILVAVNLALAEPILARLEGRKMKWLRVAVPASALAAALVFAAVRIPAVDAVAQAGEPVHVGIVQGNLGLIQKREDPAEALRRHMRLTNDLKAKGVDLVVWSESSVSIPFPERGYEVMIRDEFARSLGVSTIVGSVLMSVDAIDPRLYNTALSIDTRGEVTGRYDKEYLLAFGEYLPFGGLIPKLYEWSPNSGRFTPGTLVDPLPVTLAGITHPVSVLICYEDILPTFTNHVVAVAKPELLVNMSNDAWFGDTAEPWEHLALAQLRAIEHRRYLLRSTNSGVSAIVDPVGRVMVHSQTFDEEALDAIVHWTHARTIYESLGDVPWIALTIFIVAAAFWRRKAVPPVLAALVVGCGTAGSGADAGSRDAASRADAATDARAAEDTGVDAAIVDAGVCPAIAPINFGSASCDDCTSQRCCASATACVTASADGGGGECGFLANCLADCQGAEGDAGSGDAEVGCTEDCNHQYDAGQAAYAAAKACIHQACMNDAGTGPCN